VEIGEFEVYEAIVQGEQLDDLIIRLENLLTDLKRYQAGQLYKQQQENTAKDTEKAPAPATPPAPAPAAGPAPAATPAPTAAPAAAPPPGPTAAEPINLGALSLVIAPGWAKQEGVEEGDNVKLVLGGPEVGGAALVFLVSVQPLAAGTNLATYAANVAKGWPEGTLGDNQPAQLAGADARHLVITSKGKALLIYCLVRGDQGITLTAVVPTGAVDEAQKALAPLYDSVKLP
jgi:hypothetical protein